MEKQEDDKGVLTTKPTAIPQNAEPPVSITRITYAIAGQTVAVRVSGDPDPTNNGLHHLYTDHLGSISAIGQANGAVQATRYLPFGGYRAGSSPNPITSHAYTSQQENMDIGLYYYNARYYAPYLNRFISADTLVPDPANPQAFNRYSYVQNRPLNFNDPTGHCEFGTNENGETIITRFDCSLDEFDALPIELRLLWMQTFMRQVPGAQNWFNNIVGIIEGFVEYGLAESGSWLSIVDAGILQGIQDGYTLSEGTATYSTNNPGSLLWKDFFDILNDSTYDDFERIRRWGVAEQAATNFGMEEAARRGLSPNGYEWIFLQTGNIYRGAASAFEGGLGTPLSWLGAGLGVLSGSGEAVTSLDMTPVYTYGELGVSAGFSLGSFFNDPRSLWNGHSPVYWYSTLIWANQETHQWP